MYRKFNKSYEFKGWKVTNTPYEELSGTFLNISLKCGVVWCGVVGMWAVIVVSGNQSCSGYGDRFYSTL